MFKKHKIFFVGLLSSLAFAPFFLFPILFFTFKYLLKKIEKTNNLKESFFVGWLFGFGYFIGNCYWYCHSLLMWPYYFLIPFAITIIPAFLAIYTGLTTLFTKKYFNNNTFYTILIFSFFWVLFEFLRGVLFTGFPWNIICYSLGFSPFLIQTVYLYGCYVFSFLLMTIFTILYIKQNKYTITYYTTLILFIIIYGFIGLNKKDKEINDFKIVTTNIEINDNRDSKELIDYLIEKTGNIDDVNYIVWPEAVLPSIISMEDYGLFSYISNKLNNKTLIIGAVRINENKEIFNSLLVIKDGQVIDYYDKYKLVPFGEYIPFNNIFTFINSITNTVNMSKGKEKRKLIKVSNSLKASALICYESIFSNLVNNKADIIINITNDVWFGKTSGPYQHIVALRFRAVENNIPAIRVSNYGKSLFINNKGQIIKKL